MDKLISNLPKKVERELLTINRDPEVGEHRMFGKSTYLSVFYCLCYDKDRSTYMSEDQVAEEIDTDLNEEEDIRLDAIREENWRDVSDEGENKKNIHALRWEVYVKNKQELIKREFLVSVPNPKGGKIVWACGKYHIIYEKKDYKDIGLRGFDFKLFEEQEGRETRQGLDEYPYLKHLIQLWSVDWVKKMVKMNEAVGRKNIFTMDGGGKRLVGPFKSQEFWKCIGYILLVVNYRKKGRKILKKILLIWHLLKNKQTFVEKPIQIWYVVLTIAIFTYMLSIQLFYLTQICSYL